MTTDEPISAFPRLIPTADEIVALFGKWELQPSRLVFVDERSRCGCADCVLLVEFAGGVRQAVKAREGSDSIEALIRFSGWPEDFIGGISDGFSGDDELCRNEDQVDYLKGFSLGAAVKQLVPPEDNPRC